MRSISATLTVVVLMSLAAPALAEVPVLVMPFADSTGGNSKWLETSIQQSLVGDVGRGGSFKPVAAAATGQPSDDLAVAIAAARAANVPYVVFGSYQVQGDQIRVVANAVDVERMQLVGGVRVGRNKRDVFSATDALGSHVMGHLNSARGNAIAAPTNAIGASPISRVQMPLTSVPMSYVDWAGEAKRKSVHDRLSHFAQLHPKTFVVDNPLEKIPGRLVAADRNSGGPYSNTMQGGAGNQITRSDGNQIIGGDGNVIDEAPHTLQRGDGNTMSFNRGEAIPDGRGFGNTMRFNRGPRTPSGNANVPGAGAGNQVDGAAGGSVRPGSGNAIRSGTGNAVRPGSGSAVNPRSGSAVNPPKSGNQ